MRGFGGYSLGFPTINSYKDYLSFRPNRSNFANYASIPTSIPTAPPAKPKPTSVKTGRSRFRGGKRNRMGQVSQATLDHLNSLRPKPNNEALHKQQQDIISRIRGITPSFTPNVAPNIMQANPSLGTYRGAMGHTMLGGYKLF